MRHSTIGRAAMVFGFAMVINLVAISCGGGMDDTQRDVAQMAEAANSLLASLSSSQRAQVTFDFDSDERERWHFIPPEAFERKGVPLKEMNETQRARAHELLRSGLSQRGYMTAQDIMEAEGILGLLEGEGRQFPRDPELYYVQVFGEPSTDDTWGWRWTGHHLSLQYTIVDGNVTVRAPSFCSANPAEVPSGPRVGMRAIARQEDTGRELFGSLTPAQREVAIIADEAPTNVVSPIRPQIDPLSPVGIGATELNSVQRMLLMDIIDSWIDLMNDDIASLRRSKVLSGGTDNITFAWAGGPLRGDVSYFRVQGPSFLIEFDNTQEDPNHIHAGWRDFDGDFGRDMLREHLAQVVH